MANPKYLLLQVRNPGDQMAGHEVECFAKKLGCDATDIICLNLIGTETADNLLKKVDVVLVGGSGDYSVVTGGDWLEPALDFFRELHRTGKPTFASCWGFQAFAKALGGDVVTDLKRAEVGTLELKLSDYSKSDPLFGPVFGPLGKSFFAQMGHQDIVDTLPDGAELLCSSDKVTNHAFTFPGKPIYCTQFHPELEKDDLIKRLVAYPEYVQKITGMEMAKFIESCSETPETGSLLERFVQLIFGQ